MIKDYIKKYIEKLKFMRFSRHNNAKIAENFINPPTILYGIPKINRIKTTEKYVKRFEINADNFVRQFGAEDGIRDIPGVLNNFSNIKRCMEFYVIKRDQEGYNRLVDGYLKIANKDERETIKQNAHTLLTLLCQDIDDKNPLGKASIETGARDMLTKYLERTKNSSIESYSS